MDFLKHSLDAARRSSSKNKAHQARRSLQLEALESREMLAVSILSSPITAYAQTDNPAEIRFDVKTDYTNATAKLDFVVKQTLGSQLDPAAIQLYNRTTGQWVAMSDVSNGTTSSGAAASLKAGSYTLYVGADAGAGSFTLDILRDNTVASVNPGLPLLIEAAIQQQQSGWLQRKDYFNTLLKPYYGEGAANARSIASAYSETDVNGDGKVDGTDYALALQLASNSSGGVSVGSVTVAAQDLTAPTVSIGLKNDTGTAGDRITIDSTLTGRITDANGVKSAYYSFDGVNWQGLSLDANGYYTITTPIQTAGSHTVSMIATDTKGNTSKATTFTFTVASTSQPADLAGSAAHGASGSVVFSGGNTILSIGGKAISPGETITLDGNLGTVYLDAAGRLTFTPGSHYTPLAQGGQEQTPLSIVSRDAHGRTYVSTATFTVTGKNDAPVLADVTKPTVAFKEGAAGTIAADRLVSRWTDPDRGAVLSAYGARVESVRCSNAALETAIFVSENLDRYFTFHGDGSVTLDASAGLFKLLGEGETLTIELSYAVRDQFGLTAAERGRMVFTVEGVDSETVLDGVTSLGPLVSNDLNQPLKEINPNFTTNDADWKDENGSFSYSYGNIRDSRGNTYANASGIVLGFNAADGSFKLDTSKLRVREGEQTLTLEVFVRNASGKTVSKTLTISLASVRLPESTGTLKLSTPENGNASGRVSADAAGSSWTSSNLQSVSKTGYGQLPPGVSVSDAASLDADGNFRFDPAGHFDYLKDGESVKLLFRYTITDGEYGLAGEGFIEVLVTGVTTPAVPPPGFGDNPEENRVGENGQFAVTENDGSAGAIKADKGDILDGWTLPEGPGLYEIVPPAGSGFIPEFGGWSGGDTNPLDASDFGTVSTDANGNLVFTPAPDLYKKLGEGQWVDIVVGFSVRDAEGNDVPGGQVVFRVNGANDAPETGDFARDTVFSDSATSWTLTAEDILRLGGASDIDLNDLGSLRIKSVTHSGDFQRGLSAGTLSCQYDNDGYVVSITFTPDPEYLAGFDINVALSSLFSYTVEDAHGGQATGSITLSYFGTRSVYTAGEVRVTDVRFYAADDVNRENPLATWSDGVLAYKDAAHSTASWTLENVDFIRHDDGSISLVHDGIDFSTAFIPEGVILVVTFNVEVCHNGELDETRPDGWTEKLEIAGSNSTPVFDFNGFTWSFKETDESDILDLSLYVTDVNLGDAAYVLKINGTDLVKDERFELESGAFVTWLGGLRIKYEPAGAFDSLSAGAVAYDALAVTITDGNTGGDVSATLAVEIQGEHTPIELISQDRHTEIVDIRTGIENGVLALPPIVVRKDSGDTLRYTVTCEGSDGNSYTGLFTVGEDGKLRIDTEKLATLDKNLTYTVTVTITNDEFSDTPLTVLYTLDFTHRGAPTASGGALGVTDGDTSAQVDLAASDLGPDGATKIADLDGYEYSLESGPVIVFDDTNRYGDDDLVLGSGDYTFTADGVFAFTAAGLEKFRLLHEGDTVTLTFQYKITDLTQGAGLYADTGVLTVTVTGRNDAPEFTVGGKGAFNASTGETAIDWQSLFRDADKGDTLSLDKINGLAFTDGKIEIEGVGIFRYDAGTKTLTFTPDPAFDTLGREISSGDLSVILHVVDELLAETTGAFVFEVLGTNKAPQVVVSPEYAEENLAGSVDEKVVIAVEDIIADMNLGDTHVFDSVTITDNGVVKTLNESNRTVQLENGVTMTLSADGKILEIDPTTRYDFLVGAESYDFTVVVKDNHGEPSEPGTVSVQISGIDALPPIVKDFETDPLAEKDNATPDRIVLDDLIADANIRNKIDWYAISDFTLDSALLDGEIIDLSKIPTEFWSYADGVLSLEAPAGYFDFLGAGEHLELVFSYTVTDKDLADAGIADLTTKGTITVVLLGENDDPTLVATETEFDVTISGTELGDTIPVGLFDVDDPDESDTHAWTIESVKSGDVSLDAALFGISNGNLTLVNSVIPQLDLDPGESVVFEVVLKVDDGRGGVKTETVSVTVHAKQGPEVVLENDALLNLEESDESLDASIGITVTDRSEAFEHDFRTDDSWYGVEITGVAVSPHDYYAPTPEQLRQLFEIKKNAEGAYSLEFSAPAGHFLFLKQGDVLTFTVTITVTDEDYGVSTTRELTCTIEGKGDQHTVTAENDSTEYWTNSRDNAALEPFAPGFLFEGHDAGDSYRYEIVFEDINPDTLPAGLAVDDLRSLISIDADGVLHIAEGWPDLDEAFACTLTVRTTSVSDSKTADVEVTVSVKTKKAPVIAADDTALDEGKTGSSSVVVTDSDGIRSGTGWFEFGSVTLKDGTLPAGMTLEDLVGFEDGSFVFNAENGFNHLREGEKVVFVFEIVVSDLEFNAQTTREITVTVTGRNATPDWNGETIDNGDRVGSNLIDLGNLADYISDEDVGDRFAPLEINGVTVVHEDWITVEGVGRFYYYGGTPGEDGLYYDGKLLYLPDDPALLAIKHDVPHTLEINVTFQDDSGAENAKTSGDLSINLLGVNQRPLLDGELNHQVDEGKVLEIEAETLGSDTNKDELRFYEVNGQKVAPDTVLTLGDGTTVRFSVDGRVMYVDTTTRYPERNMQDDEEARHVLYVSLTDGTSADNHYSATKPLAVVIDGVNEEPKMDDQSFGVSLSGYKSGSLDVGTVGLTDPDTPLSDYDFKIEGAITAEFPEGVKSPKTPNFQIDSAGQIFFSTNVPQLEAGQTAVYTFTVRAFTEAGEETTATITVVLAAYRAPTVTVENDGLMTVTENGARSELAIAVSDPYGIEEDDAWFSYENKRFVPSDDLNALPSGAEWGIDDGGRFYFDPNGAFDFLGEGETLSLTFEFAVRNTAYGIDSVETVTVEVVGTNNRPETVDFTAPVDIPANTSEGVKFRLSDLAEDRDRNDTLSFDTVNGLEIGSVGSVTLTDGDGNVLGTVTRGWDDKGEYLLFFPSDYYLSLRHGELAEVSFRYTVRDDSGVAPEGLGESQPGRSPDRTITLRVEGVNQTPEITGNTVTTSETKEGGREIFASEIADDANTGDSLRFAAVEVDGVVYRPVAWNFEDIRIELKSGAVLTLRKDGSLFYDPSGLKGNLRYGSSFSEEFRVIVADDSGAAPSSVQTGWTSLTVVVEGENEAPVFNADKESRWEIDLDDSGTVRVNLNDYFSDPDGDPLRFAFSEDFLARFESGAYGFLAGPPTLEVVGGKTWLVLSILPKADYSGSLDFSAIELPILVSDVLEGNTDHELTSEQTITLNLKQRHTVDLAAVAVAEKTETENGLGTKPSSSLEAAEAGDTYYVEVWASDLVNRLLGNGLSQGLYDISFFLKVDRSLCDVLEVEHFFGSGELHELGVLFTSDMSGAGFGLDGDTLLLRIKVTAGMESSAAVFSFEHVSVSRNDENGKIHASQISMAGTSVSHEGAEAIPAPLGTVFFFSTSTMPTAFSALSQLERSGWDSALELLYGNGADASSASNAGGATTLEDDGLFDDWTDYAGGEGFLGDADQLGDFLHESDWEELLAENLLEKTNAANKSA